VGEYSENSMCSYCVLILSLSISLPPLFPLSLVFSPSIFLFYLPPPASVNKQVVDLSDELARKVEDTLRQQEEISSLLAQIVDLQARCKAVRDHRHNEANAYTHLNTYPHTHTQACSARTQKHMELTWHSHALRFHKDKETQDSPTPNASIMEYIKYLHVHLSWYLQY
jgi:hypothetical protein